ncbi:MAG TPA: hypothetical protein VKE69_07970 [Planctomycetota bacterium]|nr:hypothetical protein [Planctomycetota bacterium]
MNKGFAQGGAVGVYVDVTATNLLPNVLASARDVAPVDIDQDGDLDLYFSHNQGATPLANAWFVNQGGAQGGTYGVFQMDMSRWVGLGQPGSSVPAAMVIGSGPFAGGYSEWSPRCKFADVDVDGDLDLINASYGPNFAANTMQRMFLNNAGAFTEYNPSGQVSGNPAIAVGSAAGYLEGTFQNNTMDASGVFHDSTGDIHDVDVVDLDGDFDPDINWASQNVQTRMYSSRWFENGQSFGSEASGTRLYRDVTSAWLLGPGGLASSGAGNYDNDFNDIDNDGDVDGYFNGYTGPVTDKFAFNDGAGHMTGFTAVPGDANDDEQTDWIDWDHDGDVDVYISAFDEPDRFHKNRWVENGVVGLEKQTIGSGMGSRSLASDIADFDEDGDFDVISAEDSNQNEVLMRNGLNTPDPIAPRLPKILQLANAGPSSAARRVLVHAYDNVNFDHFVHATATIDFTVDGAPHGAAARWVGGNLFEGAIPGWWTGSIAYSLSVTDRQGNTGTSPTKTVTIAPAGVSVFGAGADGCSGAHAIGVNSAPTVGNVDFEVHVTNAPPSSLGLALVSDAAGNGLDLFGIGVPMWIDPIFATELYTLDVVSDAGGLGVVTAPLPNAPVIAGHTLHWMALFVETACSVPPFNLSSTGRLTTTFLP